MILRFTPLVCLLFLALLPAPVLGAAEDPDWPCIQRLVPRITAAQVWGGPDPGPWKGDLEVDRLASQLAARATPLAETEKLVERFVEAQPKPEVNDKLTAVMGRALDIINRDRASIIGGIKRFSERQRALAERIRQTRATLKASAASTALTNDTAEQLSWDLRLFDEREKSLTYLCEQPVLLEQRAFAIGRTLYFFVED